jgi:hypothetical protein
MTGTDNPRSPVQIPSRLIDTGGGVWFWLAFFRTGPRDQATALDKWIGTACEVAEQIGSLFVKFVFQHGSPNNPDCTGGSLPQVSFDRRMVN